MVLNQCKELHKDKEVEMKSFRKWYEQNRDENAICKETDSINLKGLSIVGGVAVICLWASSLAFWCKAFFTTVLLAIFWFTCWIYSVDHGHYPWSKKAP